MFSKVFCGAGSGTLNSTWRRAWIVATIFSVLSASVFSQTVRNVERGFRRQEAYEPGFDFPDAHQEAEPEVQVLPPADLDAGDSLVDKSSVEVRQIIFQGNTVLSQVEIEESDNYDSIFAKIAAVVSKSNSSKRIGKLNLKSLFKKNKCAMCNCFGS